MLRGKSVQQQTTRDVEIAMFAGESWRKCTARLEEPHGKLKSEHRQTEAELDAHVFLRVQWVECFGVPRRRPDGSVQTKRAGFWSASCGS